MLGIKSAVGGQLTKLLGRLVGSRISRRLTAESRWLACVFDETGVPEVYKRLPRMIVGTRIQSFRGFVVATRTRAMSNPRSNDHPWQSFHYFSGPSD